VKSANLPCNSNIKEGRTAYLISIICNLKNLVANSRSGIDDVIISIIPQAFTLIIGIFTSVLIARGLGPNGMGEYALVLSLTILVTGLSDLGIGQTAIRFASRAAFHRDIKSQFAVLRWAFRTRMALAALIASIIYLLAPILAGRIWQDPDLTDPLRLGLLIGIFTALAHVPTIYFQSLKRFRANTIVSIGQTSISFLGILILALLNSWSLNLVIFVSIVATGIGALIFIILIPKSALFDFSEFKDLRSSKNFWQVPTKETDKGEVESFAFFITISSILVMLASQADVWLMGIFLDNSQIGIYSVAKNYTLPIVMVLSAINMILWPRASVLINSKDTFNLLHATLKLSLITALACLVYTIFAPMTMVWVFGQAYSSGILLAQMLCFRYCISLLVCPIGLIGYNFGFVRIYWLINLVQLIIIIVLNIMLLPKIGPIGSAIALIASEIVSILCIGFMIRRKLAEGQLRI
jgi:O-antigen/teichoic acid export membrane protein